jgi:hypothetical protein
MSKAYAVSTIRIGSKSALDLQPSGQFLEDRAVSPEHAAEFGFNMSRSKIDQCAVSRGAAPDDRAARAGDFKSSACAGKTQERNAGSNGPQLSKALRLISTVEPGLNQQPLAKSAAS